MCVIWLMAVKTKELNRVTLILKHLRKERVSCTQQSTHTDRVPSSNGWWDTYRARSAKKCSKDYSEMLYLCRHNPKTGPHPEVSGPELSEDEAQTPLPSWVCRALAASFHIGQFNIKMFFQYCIFGYQWAQTHGPKEKLWDSGNHSRNHL